MLAVLLLGVGFAAGNAGRLVTIDLGFVTLYRIPVTFVAFGGMVVGMGVMLLAGVNADLKVRELLRRRGALDEGRGLLHPRADVGGDEIPESWDRTPQQELPIE